VLIAKHIGEHMFKFGLIWQEKSSAFLAQVNGRKIGPVID